MKRKGALLLALSLALSLAPAALAAAEADTAVHTITLSAVEKSDGTWAHTAAVDGQAVTEYDYTWHADPSKAHDEVKNAPAEYYTGTKPSGDEAVYIAHDVTYWPELPVENFVKKNYDGEQEWCYYYTDGENDKYIFGTLPVQGTSVPTQMMHTAEDAYQNAVLHITQPGAYKLEGTWHGQIWIDLGSKALSDPDAKVTLILNGVDVTCTVAPALVFANVYECDQAWVAYDEGTNEDYTPSRTVDTSAAGANVVIADGTENNFSGANVFRMIKTTYKKNQENAAVPVQKKQRKLDGAFYSYMSMNVGGQTEGTGVLNITSAFEGLDTEQHLTINDGNVNIFSQDDGINVNEDGVSVVAINGGSVHILAGLGSEGDGIDSNGFLVINGGTVISMANPASDSGLDSDSGSYVNGGTVVALGSTMDWAEADDSNDSTAVTMNLQFASYQSSDEAIIVTDLEGNVVFAYDPDKDEVAAAYIRRYRGAVISFPALTVGENYHVYVGGDVTGTETAGVYDVSTITGFADEAKQQAYSGSFTAGRPGMGGMGGGFNREDFDPSQLPEGFDPTQMRGDRDKDFGGFRRDEGFTLPDGQTPPDGQPAPPFGGFEGDGGFIRPDGMGKGGFGGQTGSTGTYTTTFYMEDKVNNFSSVTDADSVSTRKFNDVSDIAWYREAVEYATGSGMMTGLTETEFAPGVDMTRADAVIALWRLEDQPVVNYLMTFGDVDQDADYAEAIRWAASEGIINGYDNGLFGPGDSITREQFAAVFYRYAQKKGQGFQDLWMFQLDYSDADRISAYAYEPMCWMTMKGVMQGTGNGMVSPKSNITRAETATMLMRFCQLPQE